MTQARPATGIGSLSRWRRAGRYLPLLACLAGALVLAGAAVIWWQAQPRPNVGAAAVTTLAQSPTAPPVPVPAVPVQPGSLPTGDAQLAPVGLSLPTIGVTARVVPTGVDSGGQFDVPASVDTVGWYRFGPGLASPTGSVVIGGHVDSAAQGEGAFFRLRTLGVGDPVTVTGADRSSWAYRVVAREEYAKTSIDLNRYFGWTGSPRLTLITCGGSFDRSTGHYRDNVVITAVPA